MPSGWSGCRGRPETPISKLTVHYTSSTSPSRPPCGPPSPRSRTPSKTHPSPPPSPPSPTIAHWARTRTCARTAPERWVWHITAALVDARAANSAANSAAGGDIYDAFSPANAFNEASFCALPPRNAPPPSRNAITPWHASHAQHPTPPRNAVHAKARDGYVPAPSPTCHGHEWPPDLPHTFPYAIPIWAPTDHTDE